MDELLNESCFKNVSVEEHVNSVTLTIDGVSFELAKDGEIDAEL